MARRLRFVPGKGALVEITGRTVHGRYLLRPSRRLNQLILGVLARAQRLYPVEIHAFVFLSNHYHLLISVPDARRQAEFMNYVAGNIAREAGRLANWREKFWARRYQSIPVSEESPAQVARLEYVLSHGVKEGLVRRPSQWRGVHSVRALTHGRVLKGIWVDRTKAHFARIHGEKLPRTAFESEEVLVLSPLPCWQHLDPEDYGGRVREIVRRIEKNAPSTESKPQEVVSHHDRPLRSKRSPAPYFHCASKRARRELYAAYSWFVSAYREANQKLKRGDPCPGFPEGSFPPSLPFVALA